MPPNLIDDLYQMQISISNQYVLTFSDDLMKSIKQFIIKETEPLFEKAISHSQANDIGTEEVEDYNDYVKFMELRNLRESLETQNYRHYYIHIDDSLDKLIDREEITYQAKPEHSKVQKQNRSNTTKRKTTDTSIQDIKIH